MAKFLSPEAKPAKPKRLKAALRSFLNKLAGDAPVAPLKFAPPALPPGVVPLGQKAAMATDSAAFNYLNGGGVGCNLHFPGYPHLVTLSQRSEFRAPAEVLANEMTRAWIKFTGCENEQEAQLAAEFENFKVRDLIHDMVLTDSLFGCGHLMIEIKGQDSPQARRLPLVVDDEGATIRQGAPVALRPVEAMWATASAYNSVDPFAADFYQPSRWYVMGMEVHASRVMTFISRPIPDMLKPAYNFGGISLSQLIEPYVSRWTKTVDSVSRLVSNFSTSGIKTNLNALLTEDDSGGSLLDRVHTFNRLRDNRGMMLLDKDTEEFFQFNVPVAGLEALVAQAQEQMAAPSHIPLVKLTGVTPAGLNANSDGEIRVFYDWIASEQINTLNAHLRTILRLIQLHLWGKVDPDISFEWVPLHQPTATELASIRAQDANVGSTYIERGVISPDEERQRIQQNERSGYQFIEGDAPEPPKLDTKNGGLPGDKDDEDEGDKPKAE